MKKYLLTIGLVAFLMTSCCDKQEEKATCEHNCKDKKEQCDKHHHECDHHGEMPGMPGMCPEMMACQDGLINALANWEDLDEEQRTEAINVAKKMVEMKANMPKPECGKHEGCKHEEGHKCEGNHEGCNHQHEGGCKHEEGKKCDGNHEGCDHQHEGDCKEHKGNCKHEEGKKCEGNHEGCQHQHEGCQHEGK